MVLCGRMIIGGVPGVNGGALEALAHMFHFPRRLQRMRVSSKATGRGHSHIKSCIDQPFTATQPRSCGRYFGIRQGLCLSQGNGWCT
jgi:hypothetical protein